MEEKGGRGKQVRKGMGGGRAGMGGEGEEKVRGNLAPR